MYSVLKHFQRRRKQSSKFLFTASVQSVKLECTEKTKWEPHNLTILCAQGKTKRHTKPVRWQPEIVNPRRGTIVWTEPDPIKTKLALYKNSKREELFEDEYWNFVVQNESRGGKHRSLAAGSVNLADYISEEGKTFDVTVTLKVTDKNVKSGSIDLVLSCSPIGNDGVVSYNVQKYLEPTERPPNNRNKDFEPLKQPRRKAPPPPRPPVPKQKNDCHSKDQLAASAAKPVDKDKENVSQKKLDIKDERDKNDDYPEQLNPFGSDSEDELAAATTLTDPVGNDSQNGSPEKLDIKDERDTKEYPEELNPFGNDSGDEVATPSTDPVDNDKECGSPEKLDVKDKKDTTPSTDPVDNDKECGSPEKLDVKDKKNKEDYPSALNPFDSDGEEDLAPPAQSSRASFADKANATAAPLGSSRTSLVGHSPFEEDNPGQVDSGELTSGAEVHVEQHLDAEAIDTGTVTCRPGDLSLFINKELASLQQELAEMNALSSRLEGEMLQAGCKGLTEEQDTLMQKWCSLVKTRTGLMKRQMDLKLLLKQDDIETCDKIIRSELNLLLDVEESHKTNFQKQLEETLLRELLLIVGKRNQLIKKVAAPPCH